MRRGFDYGMLAALAVALVHGVAWAIVGLTFGLLAVAIVGGWLIGYGVRHGVATQRAEEGAQAPASAAPTPAGPAPAREVPTPAGPAHAREMPAKAAPARGRRGMSTMAGLLGLMAYVVGSFVAFAIVQLATGIGPVMERLTPANFAAFLNSLFEPPLLQIAVMVTYVVVGAISARPSRPRPDATG